MWHLIEMAKTVVRVGFARFRIRYRQSSRNSMQT